jgi:hypothetical protein
MDQCLKTINLLTNICGYMDYPNIIIFSMCNKTINNALNPDKNIIINNIFMQTIIKLFFEFDDDYNLKNKKNLLGKFFKFQINCKNFLKELIINFRNYSDKTISDKVKDCFRIHMYLPDLRKESKHLEFESSSIHQIVSYDSLFRSNCTYNYYSKYITIDYMLAELKKKNDIINNNDVKTVKILREGLYFEKELKEFNITFNQFINNNEYKEIIICVINYQFDKLDYIYKNKYYYNYNNFTENKININNIINLILWINHSFILYSTFIYEYINSFTDENDEKTLLLEFVHKHNDIINCGLLLNSNFENINIIINHLVIYYSIFKDVNDKTNLTLSPCSSDNSTTSNSSNNSGYNSNNDNSNDLNLNSQEKFTLYKLFSAIIKNNVYDKLSDLLNNKFKKLINQFCIELFENSSNQNHKNEKNLENDEMCDYDYCEIENNNQDQKMIIEDEYNNNIEDEEEDDDLENLLLEKEATNKETIENYMNAQADYVINEKNANAINHTEIIVPEPYIKIENLLIDQILLTLNNYIKEEKKPCAFLFDIIESMTKINSNTNLLIRNGSLTIIRRTKKRLMEKSFKALFPIVFQKFMRSFPVHIQVNQKKELELSLTETEIKNNIKYNCDLNELSSKKRRKVTEVVENELRNLQILLMEANIKPNDNDKIMKENLIEKYFNCDGIEDVLLIKKMIWFYYRELGLYEEKNEKIVNILTNKNCKKENSAQNKIDLLYKDIEEERIENKDILRELMKEGKIKNKIEEVPLNEVLID